eukprot:TRINITY_DN6251_c0_g1_i3.p1 TRINITY_DN6251_c0_g1~~TRINITY_DN6251_c0_g1_i3.p1  ORF type:complete len:305 (+),score=38.64 TRINITY_DN6251_c0_g1_i3:63-977(+)
MMNMEYCDQSKTTLESLPDEVMHLILSWLNGADLYFFSMVSKKYSIMCMGEEMWKNAYCVTLPNVHIALSQPPTPEYWSFSKPSNRRFVYLATLSRQKLEKELAQEVDTQRTDDDNGNKTEIKNVSEIDIVMDIMKNNMEDESLILTVCFAIRRLTYTPPGCKPGYRAEMASNRESFGKYKVAIYLLKVLESYEKHSNLVSASLCAINNIACDVEPNCKMIVDNQGVKTILKAMREYPTCVSVLDYGSSALANIAREVQVQQNINEIIEEGVSLAQLLFHLDEAAASNVVSGLDLFTVLAKQRE